MIYTRPAENPNAVVVLEDDSQRGGNPERPLGKIAVDDGGRAYFIPLPGVLVLFLDQLVSIGHAMRVFDDYHARRRHALAWLKSVDDFGGVAGPAREAARFLLEELAGKPRPAVPVQHVAHTAVNECSKAEPAREGNRNRLD